MKLYDWIVNDEGPGIDFLAMNAVAAISWSSGSNFLPRIVNLNGALQIAGIFGENPDIDSIPFKSGLARSAEQFQAEFSEFMQKRAA